MTYKVTGPKGGAIIKRAQLARLRAMLPALVKRFGKVGVTTAPKPPLPQPKPRVTMYDSVDVKQIPVAAKAVAGYVNGHWPTFASLMARFPNAYRLSIAVNASTDAECLDIENGDATPAQAPAWVKRQLQRGTKRPVVYSSVSQMPAVLSALTTAGIKRSDVRVWTAHYTGKAHVCTAACGYGTIDADATQYDNHAFGKNLDASLCKPDFFG
jgi:hypothetical protein